MHSSSPAGQLRRTRSIAGTASAASRLDRTYARLGGSFMLATILATASVTAAIALLVVAPFTVSVPMMVVLVAYLLAATAITLYERPAPVGNRRRPTDAKPEHELSQNASAA